jgi:hypothetical protein
LRNRSITQGFRKTRTRIGAYSDPDRLSAYQATDEEDADARRFAPDGCRASGPRRRNIPRDHHGARRLLGGRRSPQLQPGRGPESGPEPGPEPAPPAAPLNRPPNHSPNRPLNRPPTGRVAYDHNTMDTFADVPTTTLADVLTRENVMDTGIRALTVTSAAARLAGPAFTVRCPPGDNLMLHAAIYRAEPGSVIVVDTGGDLDYAVAGGNVMAVAQRRGIAGFVIDGVIRDLAEAR